MRDVTDFLLPAGSAVSRTTACRLLAGLAALHRAWEGRAIDGLCRPEARYELFAPGPHASDNGPNPHPNRSLILAGWEAFAELVPTDVAQPVFAVHAHPESLVVPENLGLDGDQLVAIDWGEWS